MLDRPLSLTAARSIYGSLAAVLLCSSAGAVVSADDYSTTNRGADQNYCSRIQARDVDTNATFEGAFESLSKEFHLTILVEGVPLRQNLSADQIAEMGQIISEADQAVADDKVARLALAYDYEFERVDSHVIILRKRYSNPDDLPCITYNEVAHALKAILSISDSYSSVAPSIFASGNTCFRLFDSLSQNEKLNARSGLIAVELPPDQQALAQTAAREIVLDTKTRTLRAVLDHLLLLSDKRTTFGWMQLIGGEAFGYQGPFRLNGSMRHFPLNNGFMCQVGGAYRRVATHSHGSPTGPDTVDSAQTNLPRSPIMRSSAYVASSTADAASGKEETAFPDPTHPTDLDKMLAPGMLSQRLPSTLTLAELTQRLTDASATGDRFTVETAIADKPVCLFGKDYSTPGEIARDVSTLYGLRVISPVHQESRIAMPVPRRIEYPITAASELVRMVPLPLFRFYAGQKRKALQSLPAHEVPANHPENALKSMRAFDAMVDDKQSNDVARNALYFPVARRLIALALPLTPTRDSKPVPVSVVGPEAYRLISLLMLSGGGLSQLEQLKDFEPKECLTKPETLCFTIKEILFNGTQTIDVQFGHHDDSGTFVLDGRSLVDRAVPKATQN